MRSGLFVFATAWARFGAALYVNIVEQPGRLVLDARAIIREWTPCNRRGFIMLALLAVIDCIRSGDVRRLIGGTIILASWPYAYFARSCRRSNGVSSICFGALISSSLALARRSGFLGFLFQHPALALRLNGFRGSLFPVELRMDAELLP
jgi:hypothetical protein